MPEQRYLTNVRDHDEFEMAVEGLKKWRTEEECVAARFVVYAAAMGYLARTILAKHRDARWLELEWGCEPPSRLEACDVLDENKQVVESCEDVDTDLWRVPSWLDEGEFLDQHAEHVGASAYLLDLRKAERCYVPPKISMAVDRKWKREARRAAQVEAALTQAGIPEPPSCPAPNGA